MKPYRTETTVAEFVAEHARPYDPQTDDTYFREPFARDTKVGKSTAIYNAHSYHTKVPPEGIVPYLLHYTAPGELILDPFCGSGMTGVAARLCARPPAGADLPGARPGARRAILNDLSPAACHIAHGYTTPVDVRELKAELQRILAELQPELDWLYGTTCDRCGGPATILYTIWSDVFECFRCGGRIVLWDVAVDRDAGTIRSEFACPHCQVEGKKTKHKLLESQPVFTNYECRGGCRPKRSEHQVTEAEKQRIVEIEQKGIPYWFPENLFDSNWEMWRGSHRDLKVERSSDFFTQRNLWTLSAIWSTISSFREPIRSAIQFFFTAILSVATRMSSFRFDSRKPGNTAGGIHKGTLYIPSLSKEAYVPELFWNKWRYLSQCFPEKAAPRLLTCGDAAHLTDLAPDTIDYIFTDPPFGSNIFYSDCSFLWEAWLQEFTDRSREAVWNRSLKPEAGGKTLEDYARIMAGALAEMHRVLKPGRWASVVFSNSDDRVWQVIRDGAAAAGFELANTAVLDKTQRSFKQVKGEKGEERVVGTDIVMNLHKRPRRVISFAAVADLDGVVLDLLRRRLTALAAARDASADTGRTTTELYTHILQELMQRELSNRGVTLPWLDELCASALKRVGGRWYLPGEEVRTCEVTDEVRDEASAIAWLHGQLTVRPLTFIELVPGWRKATLRLGSRPLELSRLLAEHFWHEEQTRRWRIPTAEERARMGDERTIRLKRRLRQVLERKAEPLPTNAELLELLLFAYQAQDDAAAVVELYGRLQLSELTEAERRSARRTHQVCLAQLKELREQDTANGQLPLL